MQAWFLAVSALLTSHGFAQPLATLADGRGGDIEIDSHSPTGHNAIATGTVDRKAVPIRGQLYLPAGSDTVPAVVIGHRLRDGGAVSSATDLRSVVGAVYKWAQSCSSRGPSAGITPGPGDRLDDAVRDTLVVLRERFKGRP